MFNPKLKETSDTRLTYATPLGFRLMFLAIAVFIAGSSAAAAVEPFYRWPPMLLGIIVLCLLSAAYLERWVFDTADGAMERHLAGRDIDRVNGGIVLDLGVSSIQLDTASRGFSFRDDGPLDMRMGKVGPDAMSFINQASELELARVIRKYGEENRATSVAKAIVAESDDHWSVPEGTILASTMRRAVSFVDDEIIVTTILMIATRSMIRNAWNLTLWTTPEFHFALAFALVLLTSHWLYWRVTGVIFSRSLGQRMFGLAVVCDDGSG